MANQYDLMKALMQGVPGQAAQGQGVPVPYADPNVPAPQQVGAPFVQMVEAQRKQLIPQAESDALFNRINKAQLAGLQQQRAGMQGLEDQVGNYRDSIMGQQEVDISPLLMAADMESGTNFSSRYQKPKTKADKEKELAGLEAMLQKHRQGVTGAELGLLKSQYQHAMGKEKLSLAERLAGAKAGKEPKPSQFKAAGFGKRISQVEEIFDRLEKEGYSRASVGEGVKSFLYPGAAQSDQLKRQEQAERNLINALLREESGAAIAESEFVSAEKQYLPRAGDSAAVLAQKKANRKQKMENYKAEAGSAWEQVPQISGSGVGGAKKPSFEEWKKQKGL